MLRRLAAALLLALPAAAPLPAPLAAQEKPLVTAKDLGKWESLGATRLSPNGAWLAYGITRGNEENELRLRGEAKDTTVALPYATQPAFSADSKYLAYLTGVSPKERDRLTKDKKPVHNSFAIRNLATGETTVIGDVSTFAFSSDGHYVSATKYPAEGKKTNEVIILDLTLGRRYAFTNVSESAWSDALRMLALVVTFDGNVGNSIEVFDGATAMTRVLDTSNNLYRGIAWRPKSDFLAVLRTKADKEFLDTTHVVLEWSRVGSTAGAARLLDPTAPGAVPAGMRIADYRRPSWSRDGATLYVGLQKRAPVADAPKKSDEKISDVEIWHVNDVHTMPEQRSNEQRDLHATALAAWHIGDGALVPVASDPTEATTVLENDKFAVETDRKPYAFGQKFGRRDEDLWAIDLTSGARRKLLEKVRFFWSGDPSGKRVVTFDGKNYWATEVATGTRTNLTAKLTGEQKVDFVDREDDHPTDVRSPIGQPYWNRDGSALLVNGAYDVWQLALDGSGGKRLTDGAKDGVVHRLWTFAGFGASAADRAIDLSGTVYFSLFGRKTKQSGYARMVRNGPVQRLSLESASIGGLVHADSTERYAFTRQSFAESPNVFVANADLASPQRWSNTNPFQGDYAWGKSELINYTSTIGVPLQGILYYPANYDAKKKYPMIVYTYELLSQGLNRYIVPRENDYYNANVFTQSGYFVLMPDIVFRPREPGLAVLQSVEPAVRSVIARGLVDPAKIGHCGHSQGGYEAYFLATHSKLFVTAVAGAGISDMVSFAGQMHWANVPEFDHWETGQFRMEVAPWEDWAAMERNNPITHVQDMPAKAILQEIGGEDPTVDMRQGVEFYNYARRAGKNAVMLLYPGEGHGLGKRENAIDYERRILQWFAFYLKGDKAAAWITDGQSWMQRKALLDASK